MVGRRVTAAVTAFVTAITISAVRPVNATAETVDDAAVAVRTFLSSPTNSIQSWSKGLGQVGKLAEALPAVQSSPGAALGFNDLLAKAFSLGGLTTAMNDDDLNVTNKAIDFGGGDGRSGTFTSHVTNDGEGKHLAVTVHVTRDLLDQPLSIPVPIGSNSNAPQSAFTSTGGVKLTVTADLSFEAVYQTTTNKVYLKVVNSGADATPVLKVGATAVIGTLTGVEASVGILGVSLAAGSSLDVQSNLIATVSDPNNDGRLYFDDPSGNPGELAQDGSLAGLVSVGFDSPAGHFNATLHLTATANPSPTLSLPAVDATLGVAWDDISTGTPTVTFPDASVGQFLNMTPRDLAVGVAQLVTSLTSIQSAKSKTDPKFGNVNLPFLRGSLADAVKINESLQKFLKDWTFPGSTDPDFQVGVDDPAKAGEPKFTSLQTFIEALNTSLATTGGAVSDVGFDGGDASTNKLHFTLSLKHAAPADPVNLNGAAAASSGPATTPGHPANTEYSDTGLIDHNQTWKTNEFAGRQVVAGNSAATIQSNDVNSLTLATNVDGSHWSPAIPSANEPYSISGMEGDVGQVQLGNELQTPDADPTKPGHGVANANAVNSTAKVTPSFDASVTLVLDLQPPTIHDTPVVKTNADGSTVLVTSEPTGADRVLLRTDAAAPLFTADFPIDASADIFANAGFLQVELNGAVHVCEKDITTPDCSGAAPAGKHMVEVDLVHQGDITFGALVKQLIDDPTTLIDYKVAVRAIGSVTASIPGAPAFFGVTGPEVGFHWNDLTVLSPSDPSGDGPVVDFSALDKLAKVDFDPSNPRALFSIILKTLQTLNSVIGSSPTTDPAKKIFGTKIPVLGRSLGDVLAADESGAGTGITYDVDSLTDASRSAGNGNSFDPDTLVGRSVVVGTQAGIIKSVTDNKLTFAAPWTTKPTDGSTYVVRSQLDDAITILENSPSDNLQALTKLLNDRLGHNSPITFEYADDAHVGGKPSIIIKLSWHREYHTSAPIQFDFDLGGVDHSVAGLQGSGSVSLGVTGDITMGLVVSLESGDGPGSGADLQILDDSGINLHLDAEAHGSLTTTIGPLSLSLGNPDANAPAEEQINAQAHYGLGLGKAVPSHDALSFTSFLGAVAPTVNSGTASADCGFTGGTVDLAMCADLPLYVKGNGNTYTKLITAPASDDFAIRLPKQPHNTTDVLDVINPLGDDIDTHKRIETPDPTEFANALAAATLDLTRIDGIDSFLNALQNALVTASFGGKLPLVGDDIQQGADFIGQLKAQIDAVLGDLASVNSTAGLTTWLNDKLKKGLADNGFNPDAVTVDIQCTDILASTAAPTVELVDNGDAATTTYTYEVASYVKDSSGTIHQAKASDPTAFTTGPAPKADGVSPSKSLKISWTNVAGADGYLVFRKDGGTFKQIADVATTPATDDGSATPGGSPTNPSENPRLHDCSLDHFESFIIRVNVSQGDFSGAYLNCDPPVAGHECLDQDVPISIGLPGLSLRSAHDTDKLKVQIGWRLHLAFGISKTDGFFVDTKDGDPQPELAVGLNVTLPPNLKAQLAIIDVDISNCTQQDTVNCDPSAPDGTQPLPPLFGGTFKLDVTSPHANGRLTFADLGSAQISDLVHPKLTAGVNIDWLLKATVDEGAGFPGIQTEFQLKWAWSNAAPGSGADNDLSIAFLKVQISAGKILGEVLGPIIQQIKKVTDPLQPVIKTLYAPIPVLSDLSHLVGGDDVTLVSIAKAFSTIAGGPDLTFIDRVVEVVKLVSALPVGNDDVLIPIGSFQVSGSKAVDTPATPDNSESMIKSKSLAPDASTDTSLLDALDTNTTGGTKVLNTEDSNHKTESEKAGFSFPVFQHPSTLFNLLLGGDVDLVKFDSGPLTIGFDWLQEFGPVYAPPPVLITLHGSASVTLHIVAGFDTYGIRKAIEKVQDGTFEGGDVGDAILQSLFFYTNDDAGKPIPVVQFNGEIAAGAEVSAVIITVGIEGGVGLTISFLWNDPNHDGKFRLSEFLKVALNNPICLFSVSGRIYVFLKLFVKIGFGPFSVSFSFTIVDVTILDFTVTPNCDPPPPKLGGLGDGGKTLVVYAGSLGGTGYRGDPAWNSADESKETIKITSLHDYDSSGNATFKGVAVEMLGIRNEFLNPNIETVVVDGHSYDKPMTVTFIGDGKEDTAKDGPKPPTASFEKDAIVFGSSAADKIKTGIGNSYVDGGGGDDAIATGDRTVSVQDEVTKKWSYLNPNAKAWVAGGDGDDSITVGNGADRVSGDGKLGYTAVDVTDVKELKNSKNASENQTSGDPGVARANIPIPDLTKFDEPNASESGLTAGKDVLSTGLGLSKVYGNAGDDTLSAAPDNDLVKTVGNDAAQKALFHSAGEALVGGTGNDNLAGGAGDDTIETGPDAGGLGADPDVNGGADDGSTNVVDTGTGTDKVYGSTGIDLVTGHSTADQVDDIRGGSGNDVLIGGYGQDTVFGGPDNDYVIAEPSTVDPVGSAPPDGIYGPLRTVTHTPLPDGTLPSSKTLVGGTGDDHIIGGDGGAAIDGDGYNKVDRCGSHGPGWATESDPVDESVNTATDGNDKIVGGAGVENVRAGGGNDLVDVKASNDLACGESGADSLTGGTQDDKLWGGTGADVEYGDAGADKVYGNADGDFLYGGLGDDTMEGNGGSDYASGGDNNDVVLGGTRLAGRADVGDFLNGDNGQDTIVGDNATFPSGVLQVEDLPANNNTFGGQDWIYGGNEPDSLYGGLDADHIHGGDANDYIEGNNAADIIFGESGADNVIGGSAQKISGATMPDDGDTISGGSTDDVILGDNGSITGASLDDVLADRGLTRDRHIALYDTGAPNATKFGDDVINGDQNTDAIFGEGGTDTIHGDSAGSTAAYDDYVEGGQGVDNLFGDGGQDDIVGGSYNPEANGTGDSDANDTISGGPDGDVVLGDNGLLTRITATASKLTKARFNSDGGAALTLRSIAVYDQGDTPVAGTSGGDLITGNGGGDVILGQRGNDRIQGNGDSDYVEGDTGSDWIEGNSGADDLVGGATYTDGVPMGQGQADSADVVFGGDGDDMLLGDNASANRVDPQNPLTRRIDNDGAPIPARAFMLLDLAPGSARAVSGSDLLSGGGGTDVILGQDGDDQISGGANDDYAEGNGGHDTIWGDNLLDESLIAAAKTAAATGGAPNGLPAGAEDRQDVATPNGQDDLMGGSSIKGFRDTVDDIHGDGGADYELGDNGTIVRDVLDKNGTQLAADANLFTAATPMSNRIYEKRYAPTLPLGAAYVRHSDPNLAPTTRFCVGTGTTCEPATAFGADKIWGDAGDDTQYGQDGNDLLYGDNGATAGASASDGDSMVLTVDSTNDDDLYGELGDDQMWGEAGDDAMLGDRGGIVDQYETGNRDYTVDVNQVPKVHYEGFATGTVTRQTDLQHDINGDAFVASSTAAKMPHPGDVEGGNDRIRGGNDEDFIHAGFGDDLANGDSGGDTVFGDDGADVMWGGKGCDASVDTLAVSPDCYTAGVFDPNARGTKDRKLDYLLGGKGAYTGPSTDANTGYFGSDILDWHPRGVYGTPDTPTTCSSKVGPETFGNGKKGNPVVTVDPCSWFEMTNLDDADVANNQHHQGIDWQYGGWDRDVLQGDVADNGPNDGDRLLDWNGTFNLYTHCNSAYGGYNDVRQHSPDWQAFLQKWVYSLGAGQLATDSATGSVGVGTSAFDELALVYPGTDGPHGSGSAFPSTPGHFDNPNACAP
jgi:Ca2+-binding RTX toxin-like protein